MTLVAAVVGAGALAGVPTAAAHGSQLGRHHRVAKQAVRISVQPTRRSLVVHVRSRPGSTCSLTVSTKHRSVGFGGMRLGRRGTGSIGWTVPATAPSGTWRFTEACRRRATAGTAQTNIVLFNRGDGRGTMVKRGTVHVRGGASSTGAQTVAPTAGQAIVNAAASQVGTTYCWDGGDIGGPTHGQGNAGEAPLCSRPSTVGFDCTGLVIFAVYHGTGGHVRITNHSPGQAATVPGQWITSEGALQPGDIVYFGRSRGAISHAAIYAGTVGGQQMIWDANTAFWKYPDGVRERTLASEHKLSFVGAVRVVGAGAPVPTPSPTPTPGPGLGALQFHAMNATGGVYWRSGPDWNDAEVTPGVGVYPDTVIQVACYAPGAGNVPGSADTMWEQASWVSGSGSGSGWINEHFIADGSSINQPSPGAPPCADATPPPTPTPTPSPTPDPVPTPAPQTWNETPGGVAHTWTNYANAGGTQGPSLAGGQTVAIACKLQGFQVADGNTWWYRIAASPWNDAYYVSADAFYNNGTTSGSLRGTPFVDSAVGNC